MEFSEIKSQNLRQISSIQRDEKLLQNYSYRSFFHAWHAHGNVGQVSRLQYGHHRQTDRRVAVWPFSARCF